MRPIVVTLVVVAAWLGPRPGVRTPVGQGSQQPLFRSTVDSVAVDVSVRNGVSVVSTLTPADFQVLDNGVPQDVTTVIYGKVPIDVTVALDVSLSERGAPLARLERGVLALAAGLAPDDRLRLIAFNEDVHRVLDFTASQPAIAAGVQSLAAGGGTSMFDALTTAMIARTDPARRQLVVAFTDGADTASTTEPAQLFETGRRAASTVDVVMPRRPVQLQASSASATGGRFPTVVAPELSPVMSEYVRTLTQLTTLTGGRMITDPGPPTDLGASFRNALDAFRSSYVVFFTPKGVERSGFHTLTVTVPGHSSYTIHARAGYFGS